jgi:hypothetical protein
MKITKFDKIHYYEDVIENPYALIKDIEETDSLLNSSTSITKWKEWKASDDSYDFGYQKIINPSIIDETNERLISINKRVRNAIVNSSKDYANEHNIDLGYLTPISIAKYSTGKEMGSHVETYDDERSPLLSVV